MANRAIDELADSDGRLDHEAVRAILPYGDDFLFVDEITKLTDESVEASYTIPATASFLRAHFEGLPLMPGVLVGEGMAQAGTLMVRYNLENHEEKDILAFQIESARFPGAAQPGDRLDYRVQLLKLRRRVARLEGVARVGDREVCKARIVLGIIDREDLRSELAALKKP